MKKMSKRILALLLSLVMALSCMAFASAETGAAETPQLQFNNGQLKIVVFADCQDDVFADGRMLQLMNDALDKEQPDLVVFTGDNVVQAVKPLNQAAIDQILDPVVSRGIPFAVTFGNHDGEYFSREEMLAYYQSFDGCLSYDADPALTGVGTCNIPVYASDGSAIAYNLWMIDSNMYDEENGGYDYVHQDQLDWYVKTSEALEAEPAPGLLENQRLPATRQGNILYIHCPEVLESSPLSLRPLERAPRRVTLLNTDEAIDWTLEPIVYDRGKGAALRLRNIPVNQLHSTVPIFKLEFD